MIIFRSFLPTQAIVCLGDGPIPSAEFIRRLTPRRMAELRRQLPIDSLVPASGDTLRDIVTDPVSKRNLFPEGIIVRDGEIYDAHETNICTIMKHCDAMFVSGSASSAYESLSFGFAARCPLGRVYLIEYYGKRDDSLILAHVSRHFKLAPDVSGERAVVFSLYVPEASMGDDTKRRFREFADANIAPGGPPPRYLTIYSMEHPLPVPNSKL